MCRTVSSSSIEFFASSKVQIADSISLARPTNLRVDFPRFRQAHHSTTMKAVLVSTHNNSTDKTQLSVQSASGTAPNHFSAVVHLNPHATAPSLPGLRHSDTAVVLPAQPSLLARFHDTTTYKSMHFASMATSPASSRPPMRHICAATSTSFAPNMPSYCRQPRWATHTPFRPDCAGPVVRQKYGYEPDCSSCTPTTTEAACYAAGLECMIDRHPQLRCRPAWTGTRRREALRPTTAMTHASPNLPTRSPRPHASSWPSSCALPLRIQLPMTILRSAQVLHRSPPACQDATRR